MRIRDLHIGTQLRIGLGLVFSLVAVLGLVAYYQGEGLWEQTQGLYEHPHRVRRAIGSLRAQVLTIHRDLKDLALAPSPEERAELQSQLDRERAGTLREVDELFAAYLGPRADVEAVRDQLLAWDSIRAETIRVANEGKSAEAVARTRKTAVGGRHIDVILQAIQTIDAFARAKAEAFYQNALDQHARFSRRLAGILTGILAAIVLIAILLTRRIRDPLRALTTAIVNYQAGQKGTRCTVTSNNEIGQVAVAFNALADKEQDEARVKDEVAAIQAILLRETAPEALGQTLLRDLLEATGSQVAAIYLLNETQTDYDYFAGIGLGPEGRRSFSATFREGELGLALATGSIRQLAGIPGDARFTFATACGDFVPREIVTIPLRLGDTTLAMISLASIKPLPPIALRILHDTQAALAAGIGNLLAARRVAAGNTRLSQQNQELESQKSELSSQASELSSQNRELEQQKQQLDQANKLKTNFLSNMSHELRTPLNSVIALSGVLGRRLTGTIPAEEFGYLEVIERNGKHLLTLINDILDLSRIEAGREEIHRDAFALSTLAREIVEMVDPQAREQGIRLESTVGDDLPMVFSDRDKCRHIVQNLVANAVKFTHVGAVIVSAEAGPEGLRVHVTDSGIGIPVDRLQIIFDEFRQGEESTSRKYGGTGLGLSIARKYARLLGGDIDVQSVLGEGSCFTLRLPQAVGTASVRPGGDTPRPLVTAALSPQHGHGKRILVVEDSEPAIVQIQDILAGPGYTVQVARGGAEALAGFAVELPDAVILDLMMPDVDGFAVLKTMREHDRTATIPVLILTAKHLTKDDLRFLRGNHIHQLVQKGDVGRAELLGKVAEMVYPPPPPVPVPEAIPVPRQSPRRGSKPLLLVVEDNPDNLLTARALLRDEYQIIEATDGQAAIAMARQHLPDVILMDIGLPTMDGIEALRRIRAEEALAHIPIIALTASAMVGNREEILVHGFNAYVPKPVDDRVLLATLRGVLDGHA